MISMHIHHSNDVDMYTLCLSALAVTSRTVMSEVSNNQNQACGVSLMMAAWGMGYIIGPAVSSAIANPIGQYNLTITSESHLCCS